MLVPGHIVSLYVATSGQGGAGLGSDEKEICLLVFVIIDDRTTKIIGTQQYLVRPSPGQFGKERVPETSPDSPISPDLPNQITESLLQAAGKPLNEVIDQFDSYLRSLSIDPNSPNFRLVADGQLPLRQCLHPEASAKDINLPSYYWKFSDLRKEYVRFKTGDLSRALIPLVDAKKLPNIPLPALPLCLADIVNELELTPYNDSDFYVKESRDMVTIIQKLLSTGHKFENNEIINTLLEPGICSIDDEIDGSCIVRARGLPWQSSDQDIAKFFRGLNVAKGGVALCLSPQGRRNGEALVRFISQEHRDMALKRHKHHIGNRYIEVYRAAGEDFLAVAGGASNEAQAFLSKGAQVIIRMRGLPYDCTAKQVLDFFTAGENPCQVMDTTEGVLFVKKPDGRATGDAFVLFESESDAPKALSRHRESIGQRYIELFRSTTAEVQQVLNRSMDPKTYETPQQPLIAQPPPVQIPLIPQHVITSGTAKDCIRLRGLPYEAKVEHIIHFLDDFAKHIVFQGVHMVYNSQGQPSGECFIQMDSEQSAFASAQQKHNKYMVFGKKHRYIEVFQCSGEDMNLVLTGLHPSTNTTKPALLSPGGTMIGPSFGGYTPFAPPATVLPPRGHHPAFYPQPILYWGYPSPPVSPTTYYGPAPPPPPHFGPPPPHHHQPALLPVDFIPTPQPAPPTAALTQTSQNHPTHPQQQQMPPQSIHHSLNQQQAPTSPLLLPIQTAPAGVGGGGNGGVNGGIPSSQHIGSPPNINYHPQGHNFQPLNTNNNNNNNNVGLPMFGGQPINEPMDKVVTSPRVLTPVGPGSVVAPNQYVELFMV